MTARREFNERVILPLIVGTLWLWGRYLIPTAPARWLNTLWMRIGMIGASVPK